MEASSKDNDLSDNDQEISKQTMKTLESSKKITKTLVVLQSENLSEYEKIREKNIRERKEMFSQVKNASNNATKSVKPVRKKGKRKPKRNNIVDHEKQGKGLNPFRVQLQCL